MRRSTTIERIWARITSLESPAEGSITALSSPCRDRGTPDEDPQVADGAVQRLEQSRDHLHRRQVAPAQGGEADHGHALLGGVTQVAQHALRRPGAGQGSRGQLGVALAQGGDGVAQHLRELVHHGGRPLAGPADGGCRGHQGEHQRDGPADEGVDPAGERLSGLGDEGGDDDGL
jgi:hypothetical protein